MKKKALITLLAALTAGSFLLLNGCGSLSRGKTVELEPVTAAVEVQAEGEASSGGQIPAPEAEPETETLTVWVCISAEPSTVPAFIRSRKGAGYAMRWKRRAD